MTATFRPTLTSRIATASTMLAWIRCPMFLLRFTMVGHPKKMHRHRDWEVCKDKRTEHKKDKASLDESTQGAGESFFVL